MWKAPEPVFRMIEDMPAWSPSLRSKTVIRTLPKLHFVDPSIAAAVMRINPEAVLQDFEYFGFLFEALCANPPSCSF
jgi:predicted AAA+ superfamily ATPase